MHSPADRRSGGCLDAPAEPVGIDGEHHHHDGQQRQQDQRQEHTACPQDQPPCVPCHLIAYCTRCALVSSAFTDRDRLSAISRVPRPRPRRLITCSSRAESRELGAPSAARRASRLRLSDSLTKRSPRSTVRSAVISWSVAACFMM